MLAPLSWLRDYAPLDAGVGRLAEALSELGLVVEGVEEVGAGLGDVVVARVLAVRAHPRADRIRLVDVDAGGGGPLQIVCGAWNFSEGDLVPLAPVGSVLPGEVKISRRKMRGEESNGMLCSAQELRLPGGGEGLMILPPGVAAPGTPLVEAIGLEPDVVFDLDVSPNRPDALCMAGISRDLAAALGEEWSMPPSAPTLEASLGTAPVTVESGDLCPRFMATLLEGVPAGGSPAWMARRLTLAGMRPISAVVDASNYVMLDLGQPNHAYDVAHLGGGGILVRRAAPGEQLETLDGVVRTLGPDDCLICDAEGVAVGVAGIMGGARAEIGPSTVRVLLEAAWFSPPAIARTGARLGLHSEARVRFERGVDPEVTGAAVDRFVALLAAMPGGSGLRRGPSLDVRDPEWLPTPPTVRLRRARTNAILGTSLDDADLPRLLTPIGFEVRPAGDGEMDVAVPPWRLECSREIDLIEEVARMWGYRRIERTTPPGSRRGAGGLTARQRERRRVRSVLAGAGYDEAWTTTFLAPGDLERAGLDPAAVEVENPLDRSESLLRTSLLPGLLKALKSNVDRQAESLSLFEVGRVFDPPAPGSDLPVETERLGAVVMPGGANAGDTAVASVVRTWLWLRDALRIEGAAMEPEPVPGLHPGRSARLSAGGSTLGTVGEVAPDVVSSYGLAGRVGYLGLSLDALLGAPRRARVARQESRYPASDVDLAFVVPDQLGALEVSSALRQAGGDLLENLELFDVYRGAAIGEGRRSLAFRARFRAMDRTLGDTELAGLRSGLIEAATALGGELRG